MTTEEDALVVRVTAELAWLKLNPAFEERPATLSEFLGPDYLNVDHTTRDSIKAELGNIFGDEVSSDFISAYGLAMITGGIGIGKTTIASIVLAYLCHWVLCLKDPQTFFGMMAGSRIAFMMMSTSEKQALQVVFGDVKARIQYSPWFQSKYPFDPKFDNQIRFAKDIWIIPGDSAETTFEGYNILGGILDEADSHKVTRDKDYGEVGYDTIDNRITSRFGRVLRDGVERSYGFLMVIGQMKKSSGFASKKFAEFTQREDAYAVRMAIWESLGWDRFLNDDGTRDSFWYDSSRKQIVPTGVAVTIKTPNLIEVPNAYRAKFLTNPEKALKDLAGIPPAVGDPFISLTYKIDECRERWETRHGRDLGPVDPQGRIEPWFVCKEGIKRVGHIDIAFSGEGDALGFAMGHISGLVDIDDELKPYICIDALYRLKAVPGTEIMLGDFRRWVYKLRDDRKFKMDYVSMDGFQSTDTKQQFQRRRIASEIVSIDKQTLPYLDLREAIYEDRIEWPPYIVDLRRGDTVEEVEIIYRELEGLSEMTNGKIDHPPDGSKDVADAVAGVVTKLMGDRSFHRKVVPMDQARQRLRPAVGGLQHPAYLGDGGMSAPLPPTSRGFR